MSVFDPQVTQDITTSNTVAAPWAQQQPYLTYGFQNVMDLFNQGGRGYYPNNTYTPFSPQTNTGLGMTETRAMAGSPVNRAAQTQVAGTLGGDYLNSNPYLDRTYDRAASSLTRNFNEAIMPNISSGAISAGRYGSEPMSRLQDSAYDQLGRSLEGLGTGIYGGNYQAERDRQMQMIPYSPAIANQDYYDINQLMGAGSISEGKAGEMLKSDIDRYNFYQNEPYYNTQQYMGGVNGNYGQTSSRTDTNPMYSNSQLGNALGAGLGAYGFANEYDWLKPYAPFIGALGGLIGGLG